MNGFRKFMLGRYGGDQFCFFLIISSFVLSVIFMFIPVPYLFLLTYVPLAFSIFRMFSKNISKRQQENFKFLRFTQPMRSFFYSLRARIKGSKTHRYYRCPKCKQTLRVPKGKGKISITCAKCGHKFQKTT